MPPLSFFAFLPPTALGNEVAQTFDERGNLLSRQDARNAETLFSYDSRDWLASETDALGGTVVYAHDDVGNVVSSTDRRGNRVERQFDDFNDGGPLIELPVWSPWPAGRFGGIARTA